MAGMIVSLMCRWRIRGVIYVFKSKLVYFSTVTKLTYLSILLYSKKSAHRLVHTLIIEQRWVSMVLSRTRWWKSVELVNINDKLADLSCKVGTFANRFCK